MADPPVKKEEPKAAEAASDPEEDDLSDLDDVLDEFSAMKLESKTAAAPKETAPTSSGPGRPPPDELLFNDQDAFAKELQKEMEQLLGQGDFQKQFEDIMKEMGDVPFEMPPSAPKEASGEGPKESGEPSSSSKETTGAPEVPDAADIAETAGKAEQSFQETIRKTMERMQESGDSATAAAASSSQDDMLAQMLKQMEVGGFGGEGNDEDFSKVLMGMMEQLTNKEILYEPMKELNDKFPKWIEDNKGKVKDDDWKRYEQQQVLVKEITERFERKGYSDDNAQDREYIVERMQKMQAAGSPPPDLVGDMNAAQEALQDIDQGCPTQ